MRTGEALRIFNVMLKYGNKGTEIISLSLETGIDQNTLIHKLEKYPDYFRKVEGSDRYVINHSQPHDGTISEMLDKIEFQNTRATLLRYFPLFAVLMLIASGMFNVVFKMY